ncbi:MAG: DUF3572 domain-containing protein [Alphaproteobacteria bacterium]|jgi:hypothetical protein|nr:DUF3572 domain-containing protein [Alphaproteobacteria bacterium]MDP6516697.1 DUF3572 domain-containing protein [Alphaproteobacteria bacterium]
MSPEAAQTIALQALGYIAADQPLLDRLLAQSGLDSAAMSAQAANPEFLGGVLDYLLADEALLVGFCQSHDLEPDLPGRARARLPGATPEW